MAETEYSQENIAAIRTRLDNIERMTRLAIAANPNSALHVGEILRRRAASADLYLVLEDGPKTQEEVAILLGKSQPTVSRIIAHLYESGLIDRLPGSGKVRWCWHDMERTLGISRVARRLASAKSETKAESGQQDTSDVSPD
jgi:hypothetical protein